LVRYLLLSNGKPSNVDKFLTNILDEEDENLCVSKDKPFVHSFVHSFVSYSITRFIFNHSFILLRLYLFVSLYSFLISSEQSLEKLTISSAI